MQVKDLRGEFDVLVIEPVVNTSENYVKILSLAGYQCKECSDAIEAISLVRENPPHIIFLSVADLDFNKKQIEALNSISSEFHIVLITNRAQAQRALAMVDQEMVYDYLTIPLGSPSELVMKADKAAERIYLTFQLEEAQLKAAAQVYKSQATSEDEEEAAPPIISLKKIESVETGYHKFENAILKLSMSHDPGQTLATFLQVLSDQLEGRSVAYFKFLPTHFSFIYSEGIGIQVPTGKNVGVDLRNSGFRDSSQIFSQIENIPQLQQMFQTIFKAPSFSIVPHAIDGEALGFFVVLAELDSTLKEQFRILENLFSIVYQRNLLEKTKEQLETRDPLTGLTSLSNFDIRLKEELSRSRRTGMACALVVVELDQIEKLEDRIGISNTDTILKMISVIVRKTSRSNDISGSLGRGKFGLILPHTNVEGAKVRAERLRRMVSTTKFPMSETEGHGTITATAAVGEYPTLSSDSESLIRSTLQALQHAQSAGGNSLVTVRVSGDFKPDFIPQRVQSPTSFEKGRAK